MKKSVKLLLSSLVFIALCYSAFASESYQTQVANMIAAGNAPEGVVFEIVDRDGQYLDWALPEVQRLAKLLREKYPQLDIAVVSHGSEQFALMKNKLAGNTALSNSLKSLVDSDVPVHVCGTFAEWKGVAPEQFSELVNVAAAGPAQINDYRSLGYTRIRVMRGLK